MSPGHGAEGPHPRQLRVRARSRRAPPLGCGLEDEATFLSVQKMQALGQRTSPGGRAAHDVTRRASLQLRAEAARGSRGGWDPRGHVTREERPCDRAGPCPASALLSEPGALRSTGSSGRRLEAADSQTTPRDAPAAAACPVRGPGRHATWVAGLGPSPRQPEPPRGGPRVDQPHLPLAAGPGRSPQVSRTPHRERPPCGGWSCGWRTAGCACPRPATGRTSPGRRRAGGSSASSGPCCSGLRSGC